MLNSDKLFFENIVNQTRSSEKKFREGNFKGAIDDNIKANAILKSKSCDQEIIVKYYCEIYRKELSSLYSSKFDHIFIIS